MAQKRPIVIDGRPVGRFRASWLLFKETWRFLRLDPEIVAIPFLAGLLNILLLGVLVGIAFFIHFTVIPLATFVEVDGEMSLTAEHPALYVFAFLLYIGAAFTLAFSQGAIANTVMTRLRGGNATLGDSLRVALSRWRALLLWSVITATVGLVLQLLAERFKLLGRWVIALIGVAWTVLTYFVAPVIIIENKGSIAAIKQSGRTLKQTFGETVMTNIGLGLAMFVFYFFGAVISIGLLILAFQLGALVGYIIIFSTIFLLFLALGLLSAALQGILKTLLYAYVMEHTTSPDFNSELLANVLVSDEKRSTATDQVPPMQSTV